MRSFVECTGHFSPERREDAQVEVSLLMDQIWQVLGRKSSVKNWKIGVYLSTEGKIAEVFEGVFGERM